MNRRHLLFVILCVFVFLNVNTTVFAQPGGISIGEIDIKGEVQEPQTISFPLRTRPDFIPASIDSVSKDFSESAFALLSNLIAPTEEEVKPKKIEDLKALLAKERR